LAEALTKLLATETDLVSSGAAPATEAYSNYYGDVIGAVATLRDPGSLHTLMRCINTGLMAQNALASFGEPALTEALKTLPAADEETRNSLFHLFSRMAEPQNRNSLRSDESRTTLLNVLLAGAKDSNPYNRETAVEGLARFSSPEAVKAIDRLATSDSYKVLDPDGKTRYPVREAAATARQVRRQMLLKKP
jgi:hypothetical protein